MTARDRALHLRATARRVVSDAEKAGQRPLSAEALLAMADREVAGVLEAGSNRARPGDLDYRSGWDESKVKRGSKGTSTGGKFIAKAGGGDTSVEEAAVRRVLSPSDSAGLAASIRAFQRRHGLKVDGVVGRQTALALAGRVSDARRTTPGVMDESVSRLLRRRSAPEKGRKQVETRRSNGGRVVESKRYRGSALRDFLGVTSDQAMRALVREGRDQ